MYLSLRLLVLIGVLAAIGKGWYWSKDGFDLRRIKTTLDSLSSFDEVQEDTRAILNQTFVYLGRGRQSFAFESLDGKYVLKLPRLDRYNTRLWMRVLPFCGHLAAASIAHKTMRKEFVFNSFRIAYEELKEETGLLYLHLNKTNTLPNITIVDKLGRPLRISLNETAFVLQKKLPLAIPLLEKSIEKKDHAGAKRYVKLFLELAIERAKRGIFTRDSNFWGNFAYDGEKFIQIDIGSFHKRKTGAGPEEFKSSIQEAVLQLSFWLDKSDSNLKQWTEKRVLEILENQGLGA